MFTIYALADPRSLEIRYIGMTQNHPMERMAQHWSNRRDNSGPKDDWISDLKRIGKKPLVVTLGYERELKNAHRLESHWISVGQKAGWPLTNYTQSTAKAESRQLPSPLGLDSDGDSDLPKQWREITASLLDAQSWTNSSSSEEQANKWNKVATAFFADRTDLLNGQTRGVSDLARAMAEADGDVKHYEAYKSRAHKLFHAFRQSARLPGGERLGVDVISRDE